MMNIVYIFWMYVMIFAIDRCSRGWAKELLVSFSVILALAVIHVLERYIPLVQSIDKDGCFSLLGTIDNSNCAGVLRLSNGCKHSTPCLPCSP